MLRYFANRFDEPWSQRRKERLASPTGCARVAVTRASRSTVATGAHSKCCNWHNEKEN